MPPNLVEWEQLELFSEFTLNDQDEEEDSLIKQTGADLMKQYRL